MLSVKGTLIAQE